MDASRSNGFWRRAIPGASSRRYGMVMFHRFLTRRSMWEIRSAILGQLLACIDRVEDVDLESADKLISSQNLTQSSEKREPVIAKLAIRWSGCFGRFSSTLTVCFGRLHKSRSAVRRCPWTTRAGRSFEALGNQLFQTACPASPR